MGVGWVWCGCGMGVVWVWDRRGMGVGQAWDGCGVGVEMSVGCGGSKNVWGESVYGVERNGEKEVCVHLYMK